MKGQNKSRGPTFQRENARELCIKAMQNPDGKDQNCLIKGCNSIHNLEEYMKIKPEDIASTCHNYSTSGKCVWGVACRYGSKHLTGDGKNIINEQKFKEYQEEGPYIKNILPKTIQNDLRKKLYHFELCEKLIKYNDINKKEKVF